MKLERDLVATYHAYAEALRVGWPRTASGLDQIAETYESEAAREGLTAQQREWL